MSQETVQVLLQKLDQRQHIEQCQQIIKEIQNELYKKTQEIRNTIQSHIIHNNNLKIEILHKSYLLEKWITRLNILSQKKQLSINIITLTLQKLLNEFIIDVNNNQNDDLLDNILNAFKIAIEQSFRGLTEDSSIQDSDNLIQTYRNHRTIVEIVNPSVQSDDLMEFKIIYQRNRYDQQLRSLKLLYPCQWQLNINGSQIQFSIAKFQVTNLMLCYCPRMVQSKNSSPPQFQNRMFQPIKKFYNTLIWTINLIHIMNQSRQTILFKQNENIKRINVVKLIKKMSQVINVFSKYQRQDTLCYAVFQSIGMISYFSNQDYIQRIKTIANQIQGIQDFEVIKENILDDAVLQKLKITAVEQKIATYHKFIRKCLMLSEKLSQEDQAAVQNVAFLLIYSQKAQKIDNIDFIGILLQQCFTRDGQTEKELIIKKTCQAILLRVRQRTLEDY